MKLMFCGDLVPCDKTEQRFIDKDLDTFADVIPLLQSADRVFANLECALTVSENRIKKFGPNLKAAPECAETFKLAGITDVVLANNHIFDFGEEGLRETLSVLDKVGIPYTGIGENSEDCRKPYFVEKEGKKVAIVNVCEHEYSYATPDRVGANPFDPFLTMQDVRAAKAQADFVIVIYHGAKEHCRYPSPRIRNLCHELAHNGADAVLLQHSHCIGCYENYQGCHIVYGQGNFHFAKPAPFESWWTGLVVEIRVGDRLEIDFHPMETDEMGIWLAKGEAYDKIMQPFYARNKELLSGEWLNGWKAFCETVKEKYSSALVGLGPDADEKKNQLFSHYLDCEAHTDVWRELFPTWNGTNK
jgi:poly-gamma-glutamate synthesis protein (capsule biosynthesis protein)